ncbi:hypothetical protein V6N13_020972 [Hibiscus sabdariffa]|uniref:Uncharacterized protein n=1 Tax=Hibiscus sabdariffa TaxID=183260 RepID=A0ABR2EVL1_9ROSI
MDLFDAGDPFDAIQRLGSFGSRDPFDDPLGTMFEPTIFDLKSNGGKGIVIEELSSDEEDGGNASKHVGSGNKPSIEHPDDSDNDGKIQSDNRRNDYDKVKGSKP